MNSNINDEYRKMLKEMDENMSNPEDIAYAKNKMYELSMLFIDEIQTVSDKYEDRINAIAIKQKNMDDKMKKIEDNLSKMQKEFYDEEINENEVFEFEIACPYCNNDFTVEVDDEKKEVQCPECGNLIELDWDGLEEDGYCGGGCCNHHHDDCNGECDCEDNEDM